MKKFLHTIFFLTLLWAGLAAETFELKMGSTKILELRKPVVRFVNSNKQALLVKKIGDSTLSLTGLKSGQSYLYYQDIDNQLKTVKVTVLYEVKADPAHKANNASSGFFEVYFKFDPENATPVNQRMLTEKLGYTALVNGWKYDLFLENKNVGKTDDANIEQLAKFKFRVSRGSSFLNLGDDQLRWTPLAGEYLAFQGLRAGLGFKGFFLDLFGGQRPGRYWGSEVEDYANRKQDTDHLQGFRLTKKFFNYFNLGWTNISHKGWNVEDTRTTDKEVSSVDLSFKIVDTNLNLESASAKRDLSNKREAASYLQLERSKNNYGFNFIYRDISPAYDPVADYFNYRGAQGYFLYGNYAPVKMLDLSGYYENYFQRYDDEQVANREYTFDRGRLNLTVRGLPLFTPRLAAFRNIRINGHNEIYNVYSGYSFYLDQFKLLGDKLVAYFEFSPFEYEDINEAVANYTGSTTRSGLRSKLAKWLNLRLEHQSDVYYYQELPANDLRGYNFIVNIGTFKLPADIKMLFSYWYKFRANSQETIEQNYQAAKLELSQSLTSSLYWYLRGAVAQEHSLKYSWEETRTGYFYDDQLVTSEVSGGFSYRF